MSESEWRQREKGEDKPLSTLIRAFHLRSQSEIVCRRATVSFTNASDCSPAA